MIPNPANDVVHEKSLRRLKFALGVEGTFASLPEGEFREDFDRFAMGSARRLDRYYRYAGINWVKKDNNYPFCVLPRPDDEYVYHNVRVESVPRLDELSFDKGHSTPFPDIRVLSGDEL